MKCPYCIKKCSKCGRLLVANETNFLKNKGGKYGLRNDCKECKYRYEHEHRGNKKEYLNTKRMERYEKNKDKELKRQREYNKTHKKEKREYNKKYREEHKEEIKIKEKQYREENPHIQFNRSSKRRSLEENQGSGIDKEQWYEMMNFFDWKCAYSGISLNKDNRSIDHITPLSLGGEHEVWNCVPMLKSYNSSKYVSDMLDWYEEQEFYSEERLQKIYKWIEYARNKYQDKTPKEQ